MLPQQVISSRPVPSKMPRPWAPSRATFGRPFFSCSQTSYCMVTRSCKQERPRWWSLAPEPGSDLSHDCQLEDEAC